MQNVTASQLTRRERRRLELARESGYLDAMRPDSKNIAKAYGLWCWKLKIPMLWFERRSPRSAYGRVRLDMFTTPNMLTATGQAALKEIAGGAHTQTAVSPHDASWDGVPVKQLEKVARAAYKTAVKAGNYRLNRAKLVEMEGRRRPNLVKLSPRKLA